MNTKYIMAFSAIALIGFIFISYKATNQPVKTSFPEIVKVNAQDHVKKGTGKTIMIEYADFQCPACRQFHEYIQSEPKTDKAFAAALAKLTIVYRHFPLPMHKNARLAAQAAVAASMQNKYMEFQDAAFANQDKWAESDKPLDEFAKYANDLGMDIEQFQKDVDSEAVKAKIEADISSGVKAEVDSTPSFYIDGEKLTVGSFDEFKRLIIEKAK